MSLDALTGLTPHVPLPDGGSSIGQATFTGDACGSNDPQVQAAVDRTVQAADGRIDSHAAVSYQIGETMSDPSLTQAQKDAYIAQLVAMANGGSGCAGVSPEQAAAINRAFSEVGNAAGHPCTPELRQQVADSIARSVADGSLGSNELYGLVSSGAAGSRQLLTGVQDSALLAQVSQRLLADARQQGYDINQYQRGPQLLTAAADLANMAAALGDRSAADAVLAEIDAVTRAGPVAGDMTLVQAMMATSLNDRVDLPARDGFHALAALLGASSATPDNQEAQDRLFAGLARSGSDGYAGGIDQSGERASALDQLGEYFERNFPRLAEADWRKSNTGDFHHGLVKDFMRQVLLDGDYGRIDQTNGVIAAEMHRLASQIGNTGLSPQVRENAASTLGTIMGSLEWATADFIANAKGDAEAKVEIIRFFTDKLTDKLIKTGAKQLPEGDARDAGTQAAKGFVDKLWQGITDWMASGEIQRGNEVTGPMVGLSQVLRDAMSDGESYLLNAFDLREDLYYDP